MNTRDKQLITKFLLGGAGLGAATAGTAALIDYVKYLNQKAKMENDPNSLDDDTIYIDKTIPGVNKSASLNAGLAVAGGLGAGVASYVALSKLYQILKKKQLQKDLDEAQSIYTDTVTKTASEGKPVSQSELLMSGAPVGALILAALASGAITYQSLRKQFPSIADSRKENLKRKAMMDTSPSRVETRYVDEEGNPIKMASTQGLTERDYELGMAFAGFMAKQANDDNPLLDSLYAAVIAGRYNDLCDVVAYQDTQAIIDMTKSAGDLSDELNNDGLAIVSTVIARTPELQTLYSLATMDTLFEKSAYFLDKVTTMDDEDIAVLCKIAAAMGEGMIKEIPMVGTPVVVDETEEEEDDEEDEDQEDDVEDEDEDDDSDLEDEAYMGNQGIVAQIMDMINSNPKMFKEKTKDIVDDALS
jgi:hypothetical protein